AAQRTSGFCRIFSNSPPSARTISPIGPARESPAMAVPTLQQVLRQLCQFAGAPSSDELGDGELLNQFVQHKDEASFARLLQRHGHMVLAVCRSFLHNAQDAEDAFQATFLVLVRSAASVRKQSSLSSWLYGVAYRTALKARAAAARRRRQEQIA